MREALELPDNIVPKTIRHTVATQLRTRGVPQEQISTLLGHAYANRTTGVYAKYDPEYLKRAAESLTMLWQDISAAADQWYADHIRTTKGNKRGLEIDRDRSEERRVGKEGVSTCRIRVSPDH